MDARLGTVSHLFNSIHRKFYLHLYKILPKFSDYRKAMPMSFEMLAAELLKPCALWLSLNSCLELERS